MSSFIAILEDDPRRIERMSPWLRKLLPDHTLIVFDHAGQMISWLGDHLPEVALILLDHDLPILGVDVVQDHGTGRDVADYLATLAPTCPVIVHSANTFAAPEMVTVLADAGWPTWRVEPYWDLAWIDELWSARLAKLVERRWLVRLPESPPPSR